MKYLVLIFLFAYAISTSKMGYPTAVADIFKGLKSKIYKCVTEKELISQELKDLATKHINSDESQPLMFHSIELTLEDRKAIRDCKRAALRNA